MHLSCSLLITLLLVTLFSVAKKKKPKAFSAVTAVKSMSRTQIGAVPPTRRVENTK